MIKVVLFDIDGTLMRTGGAGMKAFAKAFETEFGVHDGAEKLKFAGRTDISLVREFFGHHDIATTGVNFERFFETYVFWLRKIIVDSGGGPCVGVAEFYEALTKAEPAPLIGLLTGNIQRGAQIKLGHYGWWDRFSFGGFADDSEERDEIAAIAQQRGGEILGRLVTGPETLVIGDTPLDIRCGRAIGAKALAVATGGATLEELEAHKPDWLVKDLSAAPVAEILNSD